MKTKWDVLFALFELKEARLSDIAKKANTSPSAARQKLVGLIQGGLVLQPNSTYLPNKENAKTWSIFNIMKFCRNRGINYNLFLTEEFAKILKVGLGAEEVLLEDFKDSGYLTVRKYLTYLSRINLLLVISKKPLRVKFVYDLVFDDVLKLFDLELKKKQLQTKIPRAGYGEIEALLTKFKKLEKDIDLTNIEEEQKIEFTSASTQLEGNTFTLEESKELLLHDILPKDKKLNEANEVKNYYSAVGHLLSHLNEPLSIPYILELHRIVVFNLGVKEGIRAANVSIKGNPLYKVAHFSEILNRLDIFCKKTNDFLEKKRSANEVIEFATFAHNEFQHIHPFEDGNSRVTRLIWNYVLMRCGFPLINIYSNAKQEYLSFTKLSRERNDAKLNAFLLRLVKDNLYKLTRTETSTHLSLKKGLKN